MDDLRDPPSARADRALRVGGGGLLLGSITRVLTNDTNALLEWIRLPGDIVFIGGGVVPLLCICIWVFATDDMAAAEAAFDGMDQADTPGTRASVDRCEIKAELD